MIMALLACSLIAAPGAAWLAMAESWTRLRKVSPAASRRWAMNVYSGTHFDTGSSQEASLSATSEAMAAETKALEQEPMLTAVAAVIGAPVRSDFTP